MDELDLTKQDQKIIDVPTMGQFKDGEYQVGYRLTKDDYETLKALKASPFWKFYQRLLWNTRQAYVESTTQIEDPNKIMKTAGILAGLKLGIELVDNLCTRYDESQKEALEKEKQKDIPFTRG